MVTFTFFAVSGAIIVSLTLAKRVEEKRKTSVFLLRVVSVGDERARELHQEALRAYSTTKDRFGFWVKKQLPLKIKSHFNRSLSYFKNKSEEYIGDVRNTRLLKKSDGISEFFKNISEIEKGNGELHEDYPEETIIAAALKAEEAPLPEPQKAFHERVVEPVALETIQAIKKARKPRAPRIPKAIVSTPIIVAAPIAPVAKRVYKPRKRKLPVVEALD